MLNLKDLYAVIHAACRGRLCHTTLCEDPTKCGAFIPLYKIEELIETTEMVTCTMCLGYGSNDPGF